MHRQATAQLQDIWQEVEGRIRINLKRVLQAYRDHRIGPQHFAGVTGYGHDDLGREVLDQVFAQIVGAESAAVRVQLVSGTHAIACALFGVLRPGDELLAVCGAPYDTLEEVIGLRGENNGSLRDFGISYRQLELIDGQVDWASLATTINEDTRLVLIQRSCGYSWRKSLTIAEIKKMISIIKEQNPECICFVDNCYGEFVETQEPTMVGADLMAGSLIKNPGGTIAPVGGYLAGKTELVERACCRLTAPGIGREGGSSMDLNRLLFQGLFMAPGIVGEAVKGAHLWAWTFDTLGYAVNPKPLELRTDVIQAIQLGSPTKIQSFCRAIQEYSPISSYLEPVPDIVPGYADNVLMAGGTFIEGSTIELSADGPLREPYTVYVQGGTHLAHVELAIEHVLETLESGHA